MYGTKLYFHISFLYLTFWSMASTSTMTSGLSAKAGTTTGGVGGVGGGHGTIVVTGATGKVGSRLIRQLLQDDESDNDTYGSGNVKIVALVRNAAKAREMFLDGCDDHDHDNDGDQNDSNSKKNLSIMEADFTNVSSLSSAFGTIQKRNQENDDEVNDDIRLFLACGNVPNQLEIESNILQASADTCSFCVKLSTAAPLMTQEDTGPYGIIHNEIEAKLDAMCADMDVDTDINTGNASGRQRFKYGYCTLRPNIFMEMLEPAHGGPLTGLIPIPDPEDQQQLLFRHPYANKKISYISCDDVASCAKHILLSPTSSSGTSTSINSTSTHRTIQSHHQQRYELTGSEATAISSPQVITALERMKLYNQKRIMVSECTMEQVMEDAGLPDIVRQGLGPHLTCIGNYDTVTDAVEELTGTKATLLQDWLARDT